MNDFLRGFKDFALRGNVIDLAVGVVIGAAFGKIVSSLVSDIIMPPIGLLLGGIDFSDFFISLNGQQAATLAVVQFLIVAFAIYLVIKQINNLYPKKEAPVKPMRTCPFCKQDVDEEATRCPHCTSELTPEVKAS